MSSSSVAVKVPKHPSEQALFVKLSDGRQLAYLEYVLPSASHTATELSATATDTDTDTGNKLPTILLFSGIPGSRLFTHPLVVAKAPLGVRILSLDRPGMGLSSPKPNRRVVDWAADVLEFIDALRLERVSVIGYSAGGPYALAVAHSLPAGRLHKVAVVSSMSPYDAPGVISAMPLKFKAAWLLARWSPKLLDFVFNQTVSVARSDPIKFHRDDLDVMPECDKRAMTQPDIESMFVESIVEVFGRNQESTVSYEYSQYGKPWGFDLSSIRPELVRIWHGAKDAGCTLAMGQYIAKKIGCNIVVSPDSGHALYFEVFEDIIHWITE
eukprot:jgi/Hompol1/4683/HPOL_001799-RA